MPVSQKLIDAIQRFEGFDPEAYWDKTGQRWTIGWGRTHNVQKGDTTTLEKERAWLDHYLGQLQQSVQQMLQVSITEAQEEALISFAYNVGLGALRASTLLRKLNSGDRAGAAREFDRWIRSGDVVLKGLVSRRAEERSWFEA